MPGEMRKKILASWGQTENESHYYTLLQKTKYSSNNATVATFSQTLVSVIGYIRTQDRVILPILDCCLVPLKIYITFSL